nr:MAG TPA: hypothetical protein [Caudoviricetes sp.]
MLKLQAFCPTVGGTLFVYALLLPYFTSNL